MTAAETTTVAEPLFVQAAPFGVDLEPGKDYYWCSCGRSKNQPFCDGSHKGTGLKPVKFSVDKKDKYWLCGCKVTDGAPFCDGNHRKEKGVLKYNEFLLKANNDMKNELDRLHKKALVSHGITVVVGAALIAVLAFHHCKK